MTAPHTLSADALTLAYGDRTIVEGMQLDIPSGRITAIIGANGCGKSTLLRALARLITPRAGQVVLDGTALHRRPAKEIARTLGPARRLAQARQSTHLQGVRQFDCGRIVNWKTDGPERILGYIRIFWLSIL